MGQFVARLLLAMIQFVRNKYVSLMDHLYAVRLPGRFAECGTSVHIYYPFQATCPSKIRIGSNVHINRGAFIRAEGGLTIGDNVHIGRNLVIYTVNHNYMGNALPYDHTLIKKAVVIEKNVWIGMNVTVVPGVTIGEGAVVGAGTVVSRSVPPLSIVGSSPPRVIKFRDKKHYIDLERMHRYGGMSGKLYQGEAEQ